MRLPTLVRAFSTLLMTQPDSARLATGADLAWRHRRAIGMPTPVMEPRISAPLSANRQPLV